MYKVFIVDDMEFVRRDIKRLRLWSENPDFVIVGEAEDGQEALKKLELSPADLVITDIRMPIIDGIELVRKVIEKKLASCVVLLSDYTEFNYARQGFVYGAFDYLGKPLDEVELSKLLQRVKQHLAEKQQEEEKLKKLEKLEKTADMVVEQVETYYPALDVKQMVIYILQGDRKAVEISDAMATTAEEALQHKLVKTVAVINKAMWDVINTILEENKWMNMFIDTVLLRNTEFSKCSDLEMLKLELRNITEQLVSLMVKFTHADKNNFMVRQVCRYVLEYTDEYISVKTLSEKLFISKTYLSNLFKQKTGMALTEYLVMVKMERAKKMVQDGVLKNYEIAGRLGYKDIEYFSRLFKKYWGLPPTEFRQQRALDHM